MEKHLHGEQVAAGWPYWLTVVYAKALNGWIQRKDDTFEKIDKVGLYLISKIVTTVNLGFVVTACTISPDGSEAIVGGQDGKLRIYSISGDTLTEQIVLEKHRGAISAIRYSPDVTLFASADLNREAVVWDCASREVVLNNMLFNTACINCLAWSPDSKLVATGSLDTCVIIYEIGKPAASRRTKKGAHLGGVYGLTFIENERVVSSGEDSCIRVWDLNSE